MKRFNLSEWAITHQALVLFMILLLGAAGAYSYFKLGRAEDPSFTIKTMVVNVAWPGATATEMQTQVADKIEKKLQELPYLDRVESYSQPGVSFTQVYLIDRTPPAKVKDLWYQVRKKVGDIRSELPAGVVGPNFNDEYGDVYSAIYMLTADGLGLADLKARAEDMRQRLLRVPNVNKVDIIGEQPEKIFIELSHAKLATLGITPQQIFDGVARQNAVTSGGSVDTSADRINLRVTGAFSGPDAIAAVPVQVEGKSFRLGDVATVKRGYQDPATFIVREGGKPALGLGVSMHDGANIITRGPLFIALGLLVDDAIIAIEMMVVKMEQGFDRARAATFAWTSTAFPMLTGTLVTAAGFLPVGFAKSSAGEYAGGIFWIVGLALIASWFVAVLFTPYLGLKLLPDLAKSQPAKSQPAKSPPAMSLPAKSAAHQNPDAISDTLIYHS